MSEEILREADEVTEELLQLISSFSQEQLNQIPFEKSWTAGQVAEHLHRSDLLMVKALFGLVRPARRQPDQEVEKLKKIFLDFNTKLSSPAEIVPPDTVYKKENLLNDLKATRGRIREAIVNLDLTPICWVPPLGEITRLEIIHFVIYHTQRHIHQLRNIFLRL